MAGVIGLLGGSFDPVHYGHIRISESILASELVDQLWLIPAFHPPHKDAFDLTDYSVRVRMLEAAFESYQNVIISRLEEELEKPNYTLRTVQHLQSRYPLKTFRLCLGSDSLKNFHTWYCYRELLRRCELVVAERPGVAVEIPKELNEMADKIHKINHEPVSISSSDIRERVRGGKSVQTLLPENVLKIIQQNRLYSG